MGRSEYRRKARARSFASVMLVTLISLKCLVAQSSDVTLEKPTRSPVDCSAVSRGRMADPTAVESLRIFTLSTVAASPSEAGVSYASSGGNAAGAKWHLREGTATPGRFSFSVRGGFILPEQDLRLTTANYPHIAAGAHEQILLHNAHQLRTVGEWWYFRQGHQGSKGTTYSQTIDTKVRNFVLGEEYLYRLPGWASRISVGGGLYLMRWSVQSVDIVTVNPGGVARASGTSDWFHAGEGVNATYRLTPRLEAEGRWTHSHYGYEKIPISVAIFGAAWRF